MDESLESRLRLWIEVVEKAVELITARRELPPPQQVKARLEEVFTEAGVHVEVPLDVIIFHRSLGRETDRGCALIATARLDEDLAKLLKLRLVDDPKTVREVLEGYGPLASFSARIDVAYLMGLISSGLARDLHLIRRIRNVFAHSSAEVNFSLPEIANRCNELYHDAWMGDLPPRRKFVRVVFGALGLILTQESIVERVETEKDVDLLNERFRALADTVQEKLGF